MTAQRAGSDYRPDIQGLRAVAVMLVLLYHAGAPWLPGGYLGVDVFFVISGFLIGGHLLRSLETDGRLHLARFYARRARRILPAALVVIALTAVASVLVAPPLRVPQILLDALASVLSVANIRFAVAQTDYLADTEPSPLQHMWSLGVEEQFYLVWPLLLLASWRLLRGRGRPGGDGRDGRPAPGRGILLVIGAIAVASFVAMLLTGPGSPVSFFSLHTRAWELALGTLAAALLARAAARPVPARLASLGVWAGLGLVLGSALLVPGDADHPGLVTVPAVLGAVLLVGCGGLPAARQRLPLGSLASRLLASPPMIWIGARSYALYLVHWPLLVLVVARVELSGAVPSWLPLTLAAAALPLAWLLHRLVEVPTSARSSLARWRPRRTLIAAAAATALVGGSVAVALPATAAIPLDSGRAAAESGLGIEGRGPTPTPYVPSDLQPSLRDARADTGQLYREGCQQNRTGDELLRCEFGAPDADTTVVVFGDSHAGRWFPGVQAALEGHDARVVSMTKSGCRSVESEKLWAGAENRSCATWRVAAMAAITADPPDLVVLANHIGRGSRSDAREQEVWTDAMTSTLARFPAETRVVTIAETPSFAESPLPCLSAHLDAALRCAAPRESAVNAPVVAAERTASAAAGTGFLDLTDRLCTDRLCPVILGSTLAYTDDHHLSATVTTRLADELRRGLEPWLPASASGVPSSTDTAIGAPPTEGADPRGARNGVN